jgi:hypothetical protein
MVGSSTLGEEHQMAVVRIVRPPMVTAEMYDRVNAQAGVAENPPDGLIIHTAGEVDGQWQIVDVWESEEHARRFGDERLGPAIEAVMGATPPGPPPTTVYELHYMQTP